MPSLQRVFIAFLEVLFVVIVAGIAYQAGELNLLSDIKFMGCEHAVLQHLRVKK